MTIDSRNKCIFNLTVSFSGKFIQDENHDLAIARSSSSHADSGLRIGFKYLNV